MLLHVWNTDPHVAGQWIESDLGESTWTLSALSGSWLCSMTYSMPIKPTMASETCVLFFRSMLLAGHSNDALTSTKIKYTQTVYRINIIKEFVPSVCPAQIWVTHTATPTFVSHHQIIHWQIQQCIYLYSIDWIRLMMSELLGWRNAQQGFATYYMSVNDS